MGLRDLLKKAGIGDINVVKYEKNVEREQVIKQKVVIKLDHVSINLPAILANDQVIAKANSFLTPGVGFVRNDLVYAEAMMLAIRKHQHAILAELRGIILPRHFHAMIMAYAIINYEDVGDAEMAFTMLQQLIDKHGESGRHIYNLCRSGYMEGYFLNHLRIMKFESAKGMGYKDRFQQFFTRNVNFFDLAVWSNDLMTPAEIHRQLAKRIAERGIPTVKVYGRGEDNIGKVHKGCEAYLSEGSEAMLESDERYRICHSPCCCLTISKVNREARPFDRRGRPALP